MWTLRTVTNCNTSSDMTSMPKSCDNQFLKLLELRRQAWQRLEDEAKPHENLKQLLDFFVFFWQLSFKHTTSIQFLALEIPPFRCCTLKFCMLKCISQHLATSSMIFNQKKQHIQNSSPNSDDQIFIFPSSQGSHGPQGSQPPAPGWARCGTTPWMSQIITAAYWPPLSPWPAQDGEMGMVFWCHSMVSLMDFGHGKHILLYIYIQTLWCFVFWGYFSIGKHWLCRFLCRFEP